MAATGSLKSVTGYFLNPKPTKFENFCTATDALDKILKAADPVFETAYIISDKAGASQSVLKGINGGRQATKTAKDINGMLNVFNGVARGLVAQVIMMTRLAKGILSGTEAVPLRGSEVVSFKKSDISTIKIYEGDKADETELPTKIEISKKPKHNDVAVGRAEQCAAFSVQLGKFVGSSTYIVGFGLCRPIANLEKYGNVKMGRTAHNIGAAFPTVMLINHCGGFVAGVSEIAFQKLAYDRAIGETDDPQKVQEEYEKKTFSATVGLVEKILELFQDASRMLRTAAPDWFRLPLALSISGISIYKVWLKTA